MPAFVTNGPDIPESLLEAHEEGRIVFFCGAGISYPAKLPGFQGLVDQIYDKLGFKLTPLEKQTYDKKQFDTTLDQLERRHPGKRLAIRKALASILDISQVANESTITHKSLLQLATTRKDSHVRLVTTNFDRLFQHVITKDNLNIPSYSAPLLPIPKKSRWDGIVYLHGLLPDSGDETALNRLVLTSGDFGLAYLAERWASRFVTELFRHYTVCFVGYSIDDPVMRYMMDALAADELLGESRPDAFAFASYHNGAREQSKSEWEMKGVIPLLYEVTAGEYDHLALHHTLKEWAATYRDGIQGKEMIISQHASNPPLAPSKTDYAVGRVLWALTDELAAKHFADLNPVPPLEWLGPLSEKQFECDDLLRFGVTPDCNESNEMQFSVLRRPSPYMCSPWMCIVDNGEQSSSLDSVMFNLFRWLTRHLDDPKLIIWLAEHGDCLHERFIWLIRRRLEELDNLVVKGEKDKIDFILANAPNAIPRPAMRTLWRLFIAGRIKLHSHLHPRHFGLYDWVDDLKRNELTPSLRIELREHLAPRVTLRASYQLGESTLVQPEPTRIKNLVNWELVLNSDDVHSTLKNLSQCKNYLNGLPTLLQDLTILLKDAMDLVQELEGANDHSDLSYIHQPSISDHPQNSNFHDWTTLIILVRDSWLATAQNNATTARNAAENWWLQPYPVFKRLALFTATYDNVISSRQALNWLLDGGGWLLWSLNAQREVIRLLVSLVPRLDASEVIELEKAILAEPTSEMLNIDIKNKEWKHIVDRNVWLLLTKFNNAGGKWSELGNAKLEELNKEYPSWKLAEDERDEFPFWIGASDEWHKFSPTPQSCPELVEWLKDHETFDHWVADDWHQRCLDDFSATSCALCALAKDEIWPNERWKQALMAWSEDKINNKSWGTIGPVLNKAPKEIIQLLAHELSWWLQVIAKFLDNQDDIFLNLCRRILELNYSEEVCSNNPVNTAINSPVGLVTEALLQWCFRRKQEDGLGLPEELKSNFINICDTRITKFVHGRVVLAAHVVMLYRIDLSWTKKYLLPLFDWSSSVEASLVWEGFLWSPRLYRSFLADIKTPFLEGASHYEEFGEHKGQYAEFLTFIALDPGDVFTTKELADAIKLLPIDGLESAVRALIRAIEGAQDKREEYWNNRVFPFFNNIWPKETDFTESAIPDSFARLCVAAGEAFPQAFEELKNWIRPQKHSYYLINLMSEKKLCTLFPEDSLSFLKSVVDAETRWFPKKFQDCLDEIKGANPHLATDYRFINLSDLARRYAI